MNEKTFHIELTEEQLSIIEAGLKELPGKVCLPVLSSLIKQISAQNEVEEKDSNDK